MCLDLGTFVPHQCLPIAVLRGRTLAVDAAIELYQFLCFLRLRDGSPLQDREEAGGGFAFPEPRHPEGKRYITP